MSLSKRAAIAQIAITRPTEFIDRIRGRRQQEQRPNDLSFVATHGDPVDAAHDVVGVRDCLTCPAELLRIESEVRRSLGQEDGYLQTHHDGGPMLSRLLWVLVRHAKPKMVIETGVARGISSAYVLDAMDLNGTGHLRSIDLPPLGNGWKELVGSAVPKRLAGRWTYYRGASSRVLPRLLRDHGGPDLFVHDGLHTLENMSWEFRTAWAAMLPGSLLVSDDIDDSYAWSRFARQVQEQWIVTEPEKDGVLAIARKNGAPS